MNRRRILLIALACLALSPLGCGEIVEEEESKEPGETYADDLVPRFSPDDEGFYRMPWPSDARLTADGGLDLSDLPGQQTSLIRKYVEVMADIQGYSTTPVAYFPFESTIEPGEESIPSTSESVEESSPIQLLNVSEDGCGERIPIEAAIRPKPTSIRLSICLSPAPYPASHSNSAPPTHSWVLREFGSQNDHGVARPGIIDEVLAEGATGDLADVYGPLRDCAPSAGIELDQIAVATVFTTQDATSQMRRMREVVMSTETESPSISQWREWEEASTPDATAYRGIVEMPIFQEGDSPYQNQGGGLVLDEDGTRRPQIQRWEEAPFAVTVPNETPTRGVPVLIWEDGTGADIESHVGDAHINRALVNGFAILTFEPQFHGERATGGSDEILSTFNYLNPASGRTTFRQQVAETSYMIRLVRERLTRMSELPEFDTERILFGGHSQGAIVGAIAAGVEPDIDAYFLNGVGGYLSETIVFRKDIVDVEALVKRIINLDSDQDLDRFHPVVQLAQTGADATDPLNYARLWKGWEGAPSGSHVLMSNGKNDPTTSTRSMTALMTAGDVPTIGIAGWDVDPTGLRDNPETENPASGNRESIGGSALTFVSYTNKNRGHFTLYRDSRARDMALEFWTTAIEGVPEVTY